MALIKCPDCGKEISSEATSCPFCGCPATKINPNLNEEIKNNLQKRGMLFIVIAIAAIVFVILGDSNAFHFVAASTELMAVISGIIALASIIIAVRSFSKAKE